jgi:hypothetical protein
MAMRAKWRNLLATLLVFAVSPLSLCASTVCYITCSFHEAALAAPGRIGPERQEAVNGSVKHGAGMHCHGPADSDGAHSAAFRDHQGPCHRQKCLSPEVVVRPALAQGKCADRTPAINIKPAAAISLTTPSFAARRMSRDSRTRLPDVFAVSGILRI